MMLHQPAGGSRGVAADIEIQAREILLMRGALECAVRAEHTGQSQERISQDTDRDFWMSPDEAEATVWLTWFSGPVSRLPKWLGNR